MFKRFVVEKYLGRVVQARFASKGFVGPPDPVSNLRTYKYHLPENASPLERQLLKERERVHKWNDEFWRNHNTKFVKQKEEFIKNGLAGKAEAATLNADEMSVFYKKFLDDNWKRHVVYNFTWYRKNINTTFVHFKVVVDNLLGRKKRR